MAKITMTFSRDPKKGTTIAVEGHPGPGCQKLTEEIERRLGQIVSDTPTEELYQQPSGTDNTLEQFGN